jgi:hypothetical protein
MYGLAVPMARDPCSGCNLLAADAAVMPPLWPVSQQTAMEFITPLNNPLSQAI